MQRFIRSARLAATACLIGLLTPMNTPAQTPSGNAGVPAPPDLADQIAVHAICYSGHRKDARTVENTPSLEDTREDLRILAAMGIRLLRTYNTTGFPHTERILASIRALKAEDPGFEMYVMLGAWIQCKDAYEAHPDHATGDEATNRREIDAAIRLAGEYPDIVRAIAAGNEAMVTWQAHFVPAATILKWVRVLQDARGEGRIPEHTLITTSDNWAALGGEQSYRNEDLAELLREMDFLSLHTYAFHDTFYNPGLRWGPLPGEEDLSAREQAARGIDRAVAEQDRQLAQVKAYLEEIGADKAIHIGETGWATRDNAHYGDTGTRAAGEYNQKLFYDAARAWTRENNQTCFYFEAFDEPWKSHGTDGSEGHFGLFTVDGKLKYALWDLADTGVFAGLDRGGNPVAKTHNGDATVVLDAVKAPVHRKH